MKAAYYILAILISLFFIFVFVVNLIDNDNIVIRSLQFATHYILPWIFLFWFIKFVNAFEEKN